MKRRATEPAPEPELCGECWSPALGRLRSVWTEKLDPEAKNHLVFVEKSLSPNSTEIVVQGSHKAR